jgi:hypothetical protein
MKVLNCKYCGCPAVIDVGLSMDEYRVECTSPNHCRAWIVIYSRFKKYAVEAWNKANKIAGI